MVKQNKNSKTPLFFSSVRAGFPSPAQEFVEKRLDLHDYLVKHPASTFFVRVKGDSMINAGIFEDDILVVDKSLECKDGDIVLAVLDGEFTVKRIQLKGKTIFLLPENVKYKPIKIDGEVDFKVWGVVTSIVHKLK